MAKTNLKKENLNSFLTNRLTFSDNPKVTDDFTSEDKYMQVIKVLGIGLFGLFVLSFTGEYTNIFDFFSANLFTGAFSLTGIETSNVSNYFMIGVLFLFSIFSFGVVKRHRIIVRKRK
ncbi:hypothetical protein HOK68_02495 [Candidatus Woesearchaeota archaeon]|jgi:hypothetical protein|nr:hypothetical protein [Candidatus Woesearchaeota archaeon]MBT4387360.1 hypothetical protein [Candidatus Woesearchaeota archaeon]MBT4595499.1 hypothetical protein [Candidatus Woesearchaeota archaeon]MBT5740685.1 hypothetical protein [Candidatus Woesearchaeota archaeon]MBT6505622.1 hypothetical protein [Candidatus Woesearchaeota archaeon]